MANAAHVEQLKQGIEAWNLWREKNPEIQPDLRGAEAALSEINLRGINWRGLDLSEFDLRGFDLRGANLSQANLRKANLFGADLSCADCHGADFRGANLLGVNLCEANLRQADLSSFDFNKFDFRGAHLCGANLHEANLTNTMLSGLDLSEVDLSGVDLRHTDLSSAKLANANLSDANLSELNLTKANFYGADLSRVNLSGATLNEANLANANLTDANLARTQVLRTSFESALLTGTCLEDWNINSTTKFDGAICEYVYLRFNQQERRPREGTFQPGEFTALFQQAVDTVDLIFKDGIDWQAFFQSFQDLRSQYDDQDLSIQAIEKKRGGAFVVRVEVPPKCDKAVIESRAKELYASEVKALEAQYEERLRLQGQHLEDARQTIEVERRDKASLMTIMSTMASTQQGPKYDMRGAQFGGGFIETNYGTQYGGTINNNYGPNTEDITRLLAALRDQAQAFPTDKKDEALDILEALEGDLTEPEPDQGRIGRRLKKLVTLGAAIARPISDFTTFIANVIELTEKLGIPIEQVQLPSSGNS